jgi:hypothetical protein
MKSVFFFMIITISAGLTYSLDLKLEENYAPWNGRVWYITDRDDLFKSTAFYALDGKEDTSSVFLCSKSANYSVDKIAVGNEDASNKNCSAIEILFSKSYPVDKTVFVNGDVSNTNYLRVKELRVLTYEKGTLDGKEITNEITNGNITLLNTAERQEFNTDKSIGAFKWRFEIVSAYPDDSGVDESLAALNEIEFWDNGAKYSITNLEAVKIKFIEGYRENQLGWISNMFYFMREVTFIGTPETFAGRWTNLGVNVENMELIVKDADLKLHIEFVPDEKYEGRILTGKREGQIKAETNNNAWVKRYHFVDSVELGRWKIDEQGRLWIKIGNGEWKKEEGFLSFRGTELEGAGSVMSVDF